MNHDLAPALAERNKLLSPAIANFAQMMALEASHQYIGKLLFQFSLLRLHINIFGEGFVGIDGVLQVISSEEAIKIHDEGLVCDQG